MLSLGQIDRDLGDFDRRCRASVIRGCLEDASPLRLRVLLPPCSNSDILLPKGRSIGATATGESCCVLQKCRPIVKMIHIAVAFSRVETFCTYLHKYVPTVRKLSQLQQAREDRGQGRTALSASRSPGMLR